MKYRTEFVIAKCTLTRRAYYWQMNNSHPPMEVKQCKQSGAELQIGYRMQAAADRAFFCIQWGLEHPKTQVNQRKMFAVNAIAIFLSHICCVCCLPLPVFCSFIPIVPPIFIAFCCTRPNRFAMCAPNKYKNIPFQLTELRPMADQANPSRYPNMGIHRLRFPHMQI